ncbi:MAG: hypothetical protein AAFR30_03885, partial [Cyanobacteria bacterium J06628_4]
FTLLEKTTPYLCNFFKFSRALSSKYGVVFSNKVKLLTSSDELSKQKLSDFFRDVVKDVETRRMKRGEHRRFLLLDDGSTLILGCSWNQISKNEVVSIEFKDFDRDFFNSNWKTARKIWHQLL